MEAASSAPEASAQVEGTAGRLVVARVLREIAAFLRLGGEARFKVRAYERAADALEHGAHDLDALISRGGLTSIPGIGARLAGIVEEVHTSGTSRLLERLRAAYPPGTLELIDLPHLGLKKIAALHEALAISSREELRLACEAGRVRSVAGFGEKTEQRLLAALAAPQEEGGARLLVHALAAAEPLLEYLRGSTLAERAECVGDLRRWQETVAEIEIVASSDDPARLLGHFERYPLSIATLSRGPSESVVRLLAGATVRLHVVPPAAFLRARHYFTGSAAHVARLAARARERGFDLQPTAMWDASGEAIPLACERDVYAALGLQPIAPELREDAGEIEAAASGQLPTDLIELADIVGMTHVHTRYSDGRNTIAEMGRAAEEMGMQYLTISDHSPSAGYAGGVGLDRLERQWEEIARVQEKLSVRLLKATESDILRDGALDYPDAYLERFDVVIASIHARHHLEPREMTERIVRAMQVPVFKIWGHPLGRLINHRPPIDCDVERILDVIAAGRAAIEVNGDPHRLDLEPRWIREARRRGIRFVLSTDAHSIRGLSNLRFAVAMARRGWVTKGEVLNALPLAEFRAAVRPV